MVAPTRPTAPDEAGQTNLGPMLTMLQSTTLRPGLLVSLKTSIHGNVDYAKTTLEPEHVTETGAERARWETVRTIADPAEHEAAEKVRGKVSSLVRGVCAKSAFGLLCPEADSWKLDDAITQAREAAAIFNRGAKLSRVSVYVITGRIAADDAEAVRAINSEMRDLLAAMENGVRSLDAEAIRDAANRARNLGAMLPAEVTERVQGAIDAARKAARIIVKSGEQAAGEIDAATLRNIAAARTAFLDLDDAGEVQATTETGRALDMEPETPASRAAAPAAQFALEL